MKFFKRIALLSLLSSSIYAASVDCTHPLNWLEMAICKETHLKELNDQLTKAYETALNKSKNPEIIKNEQKMWLENFINSEEGVKGHYDDNGRPDWYVFSIFESRIAQLKKGDDREKLGDCRDDEIQSIYRDKDDGVSLTLKSGIFIDVDWVVVSEQDFSEGSKVKICLQTIAACSKDEEGMNKRYSLQSKKNPKSIIAGLSSRHLCMSQSVSIPMNSK